MRYVKAVLLKTQTYRALGIVVLIGLLIFAITAQYDKSIDNSLNVQDDIIMEWKLTNNITCHNQTDGDDLPQLGDDFMPPPKSIFMLETSCKGGLNSRQACAVESAARAHNSWHVHVLFSGPISDYVLKRSCLAKLLSYANVKLLRIRIEDYAEGTPVQKLIETKAFEKSKWRVEHTSDVLRYLTLYKFGGVYMDSDVVVVKSFDSLARNWAARESSYAVDSGLLSFSKDNLGRAVAEATIQDFKSNYNPKKWGNNGPGVITRVVKKMCNKSKNWIRGCKGFVVYEPEVFYPVYYKKNKLYFDANRPFVTSNKTYAHHLWNALTYKYKVPKNSPYARLAKKYCPKVYAMYGDKFGI